MDTTHHPLRWALIAVAAAVVATLLGFAIKIGNDTASYLATSTAQVPRGVQTDSPNPFGASPVVNAVADTAAQDPVDAAMAVDTRMDDAADLARPATARPAALVAAAN
ncbi:MAG: hypothetical protein NDI66_00450 [Pseudomonas sp.]|nr:hypothetical protein [Pseudomonas sp.]